MRRTPKVHHRPAESRSLDWLDRVLGDALVAAMIVLGFVFCLGAARAAAPLPSAEMVAPGTR